MGCDERRKHFASSKILIVVHVFVLINKCNQTPNRQIVDIEANRPNAKHKMDNCLLSWLGTIIQEYSGRFKLDLWV